MWKITITENDSGKGLMGVLTRYILYVFALTYLCPFLTLRYSFILQTILIIPLKLFLARRH
jgi:hypothetical protein